MSEEVFCDACGDNLYDTGRKMTLQGMGFQLCLGDNHKEIDKVKKIFGKTEFNICYACWIKSLGVKPKE